MGYFYEDPEIEHKGKYFNRTKCNIKEKIFSEEWEKNQKKTQILHWLFCLSDDKNSITKQLSQEESTIAATVIQWLGSPVGYNWLHETLKKIKEEENCNE